MCQLCVLATCLTHILPDILINALPIIGPNAMPVTLAPPIRPNAAARLPSGVVSETYACMAADRVERPPNVPSSAGPMSSAL